MVEPTPEQQAQLAAMHKDWREAAERLTSTQQSLAGAANDALVKEARFKGAAALIHGEDATFEYSEATGLTFKPPEGSQV